MAQDDALSWLGDQARFYGADVTYRSIEGILDQISEKPLNRQYFRKAFENEIERRRDRAAKSRKRKSTEQSSPAAAYSPEARAKFGGFFRSIAAERNPADADRFRYEVRGQNGSAYLFDRALDRPVTSKELEEVPVWRLVSDKLDLTGQSEATGDRTQPNAPET